jgi:DNA-binding winged helix-turn-helix (wHTH) protein
MLDSSFRFGRCELHVGRREFRVDGQPRALEPLVFDLLVCLLRNRNRVVTKDELLDEVWLGRIVSVGALARAVMMVRQATEDNVERPLIRTVHRVGYRFVGDVSEQVSNLPGDSRQTEDAPMTIALLPFENLTGDPTLDWTTLGLMALVGNALSTDVRLAPLSMHALSTTLHDLPRDADVEQRAAALQSQDGAHHVVHTRILRDARGYRLDYRLVTTANSRGDTVHADNPIRLGRALAQRLLGQLFPGEHRASAGFAAQNPWTLEIFARAIHATSEQNWARAGHLLRVLLDMEPEHAEAKRLLQRVDAR